MIDLFTRSDERTLFVSVLAAVEVRSAIRRREARGDTDASSAATALRTLAQETGRIIEHPVTAPVIAEAAGVVDRHCLRALDSLQLATALVAMRTGNQGRTSWFVACDHRLLKAAEQEGFRIWDPTSAPSPA